MRLLPSLFAIAGLAVTLTASAATPDESRRAEVRFEEGLRLFTAGQTAAACTAFQESYQLDPRLGTLQNLAVCHEKNYELIDAWREFTELLTKSEAAGRGDRAGVAKEHLAALEAQVPRIVLAFAPDVRVTGVEIDGAARDWRGPIPVDGGHHTIVAHAEGRPDARAECDVTVGPARPVSVVFADAVPAPVAVAAPPSFLTIPPPRPLFLGVAGVAAAGIVVGSIFGALTLSEKASEAGHCAGPYCDAAGLSADRSAHASAAVSTVGFTVGLTALAVDAALLIAFRLRAASPPAAAPAAGTGPRSLAVFF